MQRIFLLTIVLVLFSGTQALKRFPEPIRRSIAKFPDTPAPVIFNSELFSRTTEILHDLGFTPENTLFANSFCPDELNNMEGRLGDTMARYWGELFPLGGLAGIPFTGKGGFGAFSAHVPEDGNLLILFAPHVGISIQGIIGKITRPGQKNPSSTCGAAMGTLDMLQHGKKVEDPETDIQMQWIYNRLQDHHVEINNAEEPALEVTKLMYDLAEEKIQKMINTDFGNGKLAVIGGILINIKEGEDLFLPKTFEIHQRGEKIVNLIDKLARPTDYDRIANQIYHEF